MNDPDWNLGIRRYVFWLGPTDAGAPEDPVPILSVMAADDGRVRIDFGRKARNGLFVRYARIENVPRGMEGRAVVVWCLAHPWRLRSIVSMLSAYAMMRRARRGR